MDENRERDIAIAKALGWVDVPHFSTLVRDAFMLLVTIRDRYGIQYSIFLENDMVNHTCEVGHWDNQPTHPDAIWSACEKFPALAIAKAVAKCPIVMGREATP